MRPSTVSRHNRASNLNVNMVFACRRESGGEQRVDAGKYTQRVRDLINASIDRIASADRERGSVLERLRLPDALGVRDSCTSRPFLGVRSTCLCSSQRIGGPGARHCAGTVCASWTRWG